MGTLTWEALGLVPVIVTDPNSIFPYLKSFASHPQGPRLLWRDGEVSGPSKGRRQRHRPGSKVPGGNPLRENQHPSDDDKVIACLPS